MTEYTVRFTLNNEVYHMMVATSGSNAAMKLVETTYPSATDVAIVEQRTARPVLEA